METIKKIDSLKRNQLFIFSVLFSVIFTFIISVLFNVLSETPVINADYLLKKSLIRNIFERIIFAPLIETFIFQFLLIEFLCSILRNNFILVIFISGICFGIPHYFNNGSLFHMLAASIIGFFWSSLYLYLKLYRKEINSFFFLVLVHSATNLIILIYNINS